MSEVSAECTWGEGPDVLVCVPKPLANGWGVADVVDHYSFGLRIDEAHKLIGQLIRAVSQAEELDRGFDAAIHRGDKWQPPISSEERYDRGDLLREPHYGRQLRQ